MCLESVEGERHSLVALRQGVGDQDVQDGVPQELQALVARAVVLPPGGVGAGLLQQAAILEVVPQQRLQLPADRCRCYIAGASAWIPQVPL